MYEGWAVIDGVPVTTGRFTDAAAADDFDGFSGDQGGPAFPGEDFIHNAPDGVDFPTDLTNATIVISVEPEVDDSPAPFALKPLVSEVADGIGDHQVQTLGTLAPLHQRLARPPSASHACSSTDSGYPQCQALRVAPRSKCAEPVTRQSG